MDYTLVVNLFGATFAALATMGLVILLIRKRIQGFTDIPELIALIGLSIAVPLILAGLTPPLWSTANLIFGLSSCLVTTVVLAALYAAARMAVRVLRRRQ